MKRSPGQKRKFVVQGINLFIFLIITYFASQYYGKTHNGLLAWTNNSYPVQGSVVSLNSQEEEYRNRKLKLFITFNTELILMVIHMKKLAKLSTLYIIP